MIFHEMIINLRLLTFLVLRYLGEFSPAPLSWHCTTTAVTCGAGDDAGGECGSFAVHWAAIMLGWCLIAAGLGCVV